MSSFKLCFIFISCNSKRKCLPPQVVRKDRTLEQIIFPIPDVCHYLTEESKSRVMADTECNEQGSKVDDFFKRTNELYQEMECQKDLRGM